MTDKTPTHAEVMALANRKASLELQVCLPAVIVEVRGNQLVNVQPLLRVQAKAQAAAINLPILPNVPVSMPKGRAWGIRLPIAVGDTGMVIFADRDMDAWLASSGEPATPDTPRAHDINDAIFVPGLGPDSAQTSDSSGDVAIYAGAATLRVQPGGKFVLTNGGVELLAQIEQLAKNVATLTSYLNGAATPTGGPLANIGNPQAQAAFSSLAAATATLDTVSLNISKLQGG